MKLLGNAAEIMTPKKNLCINNIMVGCHLSGDKWQTIISVGSNKIIQ